MALIPAPVVPAPQALGLRYGLLTAANGPLELPAPHGRGGGVIYEPVTCGAAHVYPVECPAGVTPPSKTFDPADPFITADPFIVYATYVCGAAGHTAAELQDKVLRRLGNGEQTSVEVGFAATLSAGATLLPPASDPDRIASVVAELEQWLYGVNGAAYGPVGFLHAPPRFQSYAARYGQMIQRGKYLTTQLGTVWVFGGGYPDDGSIYISGQVNVWRSTDINVPPPEQTFDRTRNQYRLIAEREYATAYDCVAAKTFFFPETDAS